MKKIRETVKKLFWTTINSICLFMNCLHFKKLFWILLNTIYIGIVCVVTLYIMDDKVREHKSEIVYENVVVKDMETKETLLELNGKCNVLHNINGDTIVTYLENNQEIEYEFTGDVIVHKERANELVIQK